MLNETEVSGIIMIADIVLRIFDKDKGKIISSRIISDIKIGREIFNKQVEIYHNIPGRYTISLYDMNKCTNIEHYDTDDNI